MYLISSGRSTILSTYGDLETKSSYEHANNEKTEFKFFSEGRLFAEVNEKTGLDILRIHETDKKIGISRIRRIALDKLACISCQRQGNEEVALGLSNGEVNLFNYKNTNFTHKFPTEDSRNSVLCVDYNARDEYVSSVYENGLINIFSLKTNTKLQSLDLDENCTLCHFHPTMRFRLTVASYKGSVFFYDIQSKKEIFKSVDCHKAPCKDICMSPALPYTIFSVGYDCVINIFDVRKKSNSQQINYCHPLSAAAVSECGGYVCVGNLKGELISYDMRNMKNYLAARKVHDCAVTRIAFVPAKSQTSTSFTNAFPNIIDTKPDERKSQTAVELASRRDSFCDFLDFQANRGNEKVQGRLTVRRDSFDYDALNKKQPLDDVRGFRPSLPPLNDSSELQNKTRSLEVIRSPGKENTLSPARLCTPPLATLSFRRGDDVIPLRDRSNLDQRLNKIQEENEFDVISPEEIPAEKDIGYMQISQKDFDGGFFLKLPDEQRSTPNNVKRAVEEGANKLFHSKPLPDMDVMKELQSLRNEMNERFTQLESEIKFNAECNKWHVFNQNSNLWTKQLESTEEIRSSLGILLQTDPFVNEYLRIKEENESLKKKLLQLGQKV